MSKEELLALLAEQQATIDKQGMALQEKDTKIERLNNELQDLKRLYFGRKSERYVSDKPEDPSQLSLFVQHPHENTEEQTAKEVVKSHQRTKTKGKPKRAKLPDKLPVVEVIIEPEEGSVDGWTKIGEEITDCAFAKLRRSKENWILLRPNSASFAMSDPSMRVQRPSRIKIRTVSILLLLPYLPELYPRVFLRRACWLTS